MAWGAHPHRGQQSGHPKYVFYKKVVVKICPFVIYSLASVVLLMPSRPFRILQAAHEIIGGGAVPIHPPLGQAPLRSPLSLYLDVDDITTVLHQFLGW